MFMALVMRVPMIFVPAVRGRGRPRANFIPLPLFPVHFSRQILFAMGIDVHLGGCDATPIDTRNFQSCPDVQPRDRFLQQLERHVSVHEGAQEHVATHPRKTIEVGNAHGSSPIRHFIKHAGHSSTAPPLRSRLRWLQAPDHEGISGNLPLYNLRVLVRLILSGVIPNPLQANEGISRASSQNSTDRGAKTFIIGKPASAVKPRLRTLSATIAIFFNSLEGLLVPSSGTPPCPACA